MTVTVQFLANIPSPPQGVWYLGSIPIRAYSLCIITGMLVALWLTVRRYTARGGDANLVVDAALVGFPSGIIGARLYHVLTDHDKYFCSTCDSLNAFKITNGGLGIWGGILLGSLAIALLFKIRSIPIAPFADAAAPGIILAQAIGRLGNWFNQEIYGNPTTVPWALDIYYRVNEDRLYAPLTGHSTGQVITSVHPTFLYELLWNLLVFALLLWAEKHWKLHGGQVFALYVAGYTFGRFWIELMRADTATHVFGLRINTIVSAVVFLAAVTVLVILRKRAQIKQNKQEVLPASA